MADRPGLEPAFCVRGVFPVCYIAINCVTVFQTTHLQNHFATLGLEPLTLWIPKTGPAPPPPREVGLASNPESIVARVPGAFQACPSLCSIPFGVWSSPLPFFPFIHVPARR